MNQNLSICQHYTWIHWPAAQQACPEGSRATPARSNVSSPSCRRRSCASRRARSAERSQPLKWPERSWDSRSSTSATHVLPVTVHARSRSHPQLFCACFLLFWFFFVSFFYFFFLKAGFPSEPCSAARRKSFQVVSKRRASVVWGGCCGAGQHHHGCPHFHK